MSAAEKSLAALEAARRRATKGQWLAVSLGTEKGRNAARGKTRVAATHRQEGIVTDADVGGTSPSFDADLIALAVNLSSPLAAVARAAMAYRNAEAALDDSLRNTPEADRALLWSDRYVALAALFAALDALEAAAEGVV